MLQLNAMSICSRGKFSALALAIFMYAAMTLPTSADATPDQNLVDLISQSERILMGTVEDVSDGFTERGVPYTEINLSVTESLKGGDNSHYMFRQFGLLDSSQEDSTMGYPGIQPQGFVQWESGESVLIFLHRPARLTGLQTTVGLSQGKLSQVDNEFESQDGLSYLFDNLVIEAGDLTLGQVDMLHGNNLVVNADSLLALVRRAIDENWVEKGVMRHAN